MMPFSIIWTAQAFSLLGSALVQFTLVWWLTEKTGSATVLALSSAMALLPQVFIGPFAGPLVDRWDRRVVMQVADGFITLATGLLIVMFALDMAQIWHVYIVMFARSVGTAFHWPAMQVATSLLVPKQHLSRVAGLNQSLEGLARILMPPLGALLLQWMPLEGVLAIDVATAFFAIVLLFFVRIPRVNEKTAKQASQESLFTELKAGLQFVKSLPGLRILILLGPLFSLLMFPALSFQPLLVTLHFQAGALELAALQSSFGFGIVAGGLTLSIWGGFEQRSITGFLGLVLRGIGLSIVGMASANDFWLAVGAIFLTGFMTPIVTGSLFSVMQASIPTEIQGRVFTLMRSGFTAAPLIGLLIAGPLAEIWGVRPWFVIAGTVMAFVGVGAFFIPQIKEFERLTYTIDKAGRVKAQ